MQIFYVGVTLMTYLGIKLKLTVLPIDIKFTQVLGIAFLAGYCFTMSIFIANLAFVNNVVYIESSKIGILIGLLISGITGYSILRLSSRIHKK